MGILISFCCIFTLVTVLAMIIEPSRFRNGILILFCFGLVSDSRSCDLFFGARSWAWPCLSCIFLFFCFLSRGSFRTGE